MLKKIKNITPMPTIFPSSITTILSASITEEILWAIIILVVFFRDVAKACRIFASGSFLTTGNLLFAM